MAVDMKKVLSSVDMLLEGLGLDEEETSEDTDTEPAGDGGESDTSDEMTDEEKEAAKADGQDGEDTEDDKKKDDEMVDKTVNKALNKVFTRIQKSDSQTAAVLEKLVKANADMVKKQNAQDDALGLLLEGFGLKEAVLKSHEDANKPAPGKATMEDVLLAINKSNENLAQAILGNQNGGGMQVQKSAPHSTTIMQNGFGKNDGTGQQSQQGNMDSIVNKDFVSGFGKLLKLKENA